MKRSFELNENKKESLECLKHWPENEMKYLLNFPFLIQSSKYTVALSHPMGKIKEKKSKIIFNFSLNSGKLIKM